MKNVKIEFISFKSLSIYNYNIEIYHNGKCIYKNIINNKKSINVNLKENEIYKIILIIKRNNSSCYIEKYFVSNSNKIQIFFDNNQKFKIIKIFLRDNNYSNLMVNKGIIYLNF